MMLRIQHERAGGGPVDVEAYHREFGLTAARLARAAPKAIVMHPGPMNRGVEIDPDVADGPQSAIRRQVAQRRRRAHGRARAACRGAPGARHVSTAPAHRGTIFLEDAAVLDHRAFDGGQFVMRLAAPRCAAAATPGSFIHLTCGPDLPMRRPLRSCARTAREGWVEVLYKVVGHGLARTCAAQRRARSSPCLGPIGRGFTADPARPRRLLVRRRRRHPADGVLCGVARRGATAPPPRTDGLGAASSLRPRRVAAAGAWPAEGCDCGDAAARELSACHRALRASSGFVRAAIAATSPNSPTPGSVARRGRTR